MWSAPRPSYGQFHYYHHYQHHPYYLYPRDQTGCCDAAHDTFLPGDACPARRRGEVGIGPFRSERSACAAIRRQVRDGQPLTRAQMTYIALNSA